MRDLTMRNLAPCRLMSPAACRHEGTDNPIAHNHMLRSGQQDLGARNGARRSPPLPDTLRPVVLSVAAFKGMEAIDGGDTIVVRFVAPDGREIALLVPQDAVAGLKTRLSSLG